MERVADAVETSWPTDVEDTALIQGTAHDACICKHSAVRKRYFEDEYIHHFVRGYIRKQPIINLGYFTRVQAISQVAHSFLRATEKTTDDEIVDRQVLNLGAGFDTLYFNLKHTGTHRNIRYFEVDFATVIRHKFKILSTVPALRDLLGMGPADAEEKTQYATEFGFQIGAYSLINADLNDARSVVELLRIAGFRRELPTVIITECVLVYMTSSTALALVQEIGAVCDNALWVSYDMVNPNTGVSMYAFLAKSDAPSSYTDFGKVMVKNITSAGFSIPGMLAFPTLRNQEERFNLHGWNISRAITMKDVYDTWLSDDEHGRLEPLDEYEEWNLLMSHYCLTVAAIGTHCTEVARALVPR